MERLLLFVATVSALFLNSSLVFLLGIEQTTTFAFTPLIFYILIRYLSGKIDFNSRKNERELILILFGLFILFFKTIIEQDYLKPVLCLLFIPMLTSITFKTLNFREIQLLRYVVLTYFFVICALAIVEKINGINYIIDPQQEEVYTPVDREQWEFRSTSILGHPLANAMVVAVLMTFVLLSNSGIYLKLLVLITGFVSLFCFNARGATLVSGVILIPYFFQLIWKQNKRRGWWLTMGVFSLSALFYYVTTTSLGGRILHGGKLLDGSAMTRIQVWNFHKFLSSQDLWLGHPDLYLKIMHKLGAGGVENGIITIILNYGLLLSMFLLPLLFLFHNKLLRIYKKNDRYIILAIFYIIGIMNPNLAMPVQWTVFLFAYYAFRPQRMYKIFKKSHENRNYIRLQR